MTPMASSQRRVSIVIPTYNQAGYLGEAIESALAQTRRADEIIVIDNDSTDHTSQVAAGYPAVRYIRQPNRGVCGSTNRGIHEATGDYLVILHSDDRLFPNHLETSLAAFERHPEAAFVCGDYRWFGIGDSWHRHRCEPAPDYYATLLRLNFIGPPLVIMFRRDVLLKTGGFDAKYFGADDQELYLRIARYYPIHCHHEVVAEYRRHEGQNSKRTAMMLKASMAVMQAQRPYLARNPAYQEAYREGIRHRQKLYGESLFWQGVAAFKAGQTREALACVSVLLRHDPQGLLGPMCRHLFGFPHPRTV